ncbi:MAG TPA: YCF48-related protein [Bacteroidia bacterium]|jgi:photosystem II stability/assembly factor-like uncharacterized protein|nr:YCF48-related protein [Bacteroidia bacterium]
MKKNLPALFILCSVPAFAQWHQLIPSSPDIFTQLSFPADDTGYSIAGKLCRTFDGGVSFDTVHIPGLAQYQSVFFRNGKDGVVTGTNSGARILRSLDRGTTWSNITPANFIGAPMFAEFHSPTKGSCITSAPYYFRTFDAGATWDTISFGYDYFNSISFPDSMIGYLGGFDGTFAYRGVVAKTIDGGLTWNIFTQLNDWNTDIAQIQFVSQDTGFAIYTTTSNISPIIRTRDGAATWDTVFFSSGHIVRIAFADHNNGFLVNDSGSVYRTSDGGVNWNFDFHAPGYFSDLCVTRHYAYACGGQGMMYKRDWLSSVAENDVRREISVYPCPATDVLYLDEGTPGDIIYVYDVNGKCVKKQRIRQTGVISLCVDDLAAGNYFLWLNSGTSVVRFVKE